jgi:hypothetical protein
MVLERRLQERSAHEPEKNKKWEIGNSFPPLLTLIKFVMIISTAPIKKRLYFSK